MPYQSRRQAGRWVTSRTSKPCIHRFASEDEIDDPGNNEPSPEPRRAVGKALPRSEGDIGELSTVHPVDVRSARRDWKSKTLPGSEGMIDAELDSNQSDPE